MIVNSINNRINPTIILLNNRASSAQLHSAKPSQTSDSLQKQMSFMGLLNSPLRKIKPDLLQTYIKNLHSVKSGDVIILYKKNSYKSYTSTILLDKPLNLSDGINSLVENINHYNFTNNTNPTIRRPMLQDFQYYKEIIQDVPELEKIKIKGVIGNGAFSTAFLTAENDILKLSQDPNFPHPKDFVKGVEIPIIEGYAINKNNKPLYAVKELFAVDGTTKGISSIDHAIVWNKLNEKMKKHFPEYEFEGDYQKDSLLAAKQIGFIENTPYLLDHGSISNRILLEIQDADSQFNLSDYPVYFINR